MDEKEYDKVGSEGRNTDNNSEYSTKENTKMLATIAADCNDVLDFLQSDAVNSVRIITTQTQKCLVLHMVREQPPTPHHRTTISHRINRTPQ